MKKEFLCINIAFLCIGVYTVLIESHEKEGYRYELKRKKFSHIEGFYAGGDHISA